MILSLTLLCTAGLTLSHHADGSLTTHRLQVMPPLKRINTMSPSPALLIYAAEVHNLLTRVERVTTAYVPTLHCCCLPLAYTAAAAAQSAAQTAVLAAASPAAALTANPAAAGRLLSHSPKSYPAVAMKSS